MAHIEVIRKSRQIWKIHKVLSKNLDLMKEHQKNDWDFKVPISGDGMTRTGKSTMGFQICDYCDEDFVPNWRERTIFNGEKLIETAYKVPKGSWLLYDEAREGLDSKKQMEKYTQNLLDFFSQCGNLNLGIVIVLPEFFELPKTVAITQTICLINCFAKEGFQRGYFEFYNRKHKKYLFMKGQKFLDYSAQTPSWTGTFTKYFPIDRKEYERIKSETLQQIRKRENVSEIKEKEETQRIRVTILIRHMMKDLKIKPAFIGELLGIARTTVYGYLKPKKK